MTTQNGSQGDIAENIIDLQTFPILTEEVNGTGVAAASSSSGGTLAPSGSVVEQTLRGILGWRPRVADPKGFLTALSSSFVQVEEDGHKEWYWSPTSYTIQTDIGAVTGAQASLHHRAQVALRESKNILDRLVPLRSDADEDDVDASRAIAESYLTELVNEFGLMGGPRVQRIDILFDSLFGRDFDFSNPENVQGILGQLGERLGLNRDEVNTIEEEQNLTDFFILVDHVSALRNTFDAQRNFFDRQGSDVFLGTQLILLSRALSSLGESVIQTNNVLDSVFVGAAERESIQLSLGANEPTITIAELLNWAGHVANEEGPRLIREGGKDGAFALTPTLEELARLFTAAEKLSRNHSHNPTRGFHTARVQRAFEELTVHSSQAAKLAGQLTRDKMQKPPIRINSVHFEPQVLQPGSMLKIEVWVENIGDETVPTQGPAPGTPYDEGSSDDTVGDTFITLGHEGVEGAVRVAVDYEERPGDVVEFPYRWGLGGPLAPGEERMITGVIRLHKRRTQEFCVALICEEVGLIDEAICCETITVRRWFAKAQSPAPEAPPSTFAESSATPPSETATPAVAQSAEPAHVMAAHTTASTHTSTAASPAQSNPSAESAQTMLDAQQDETTVEDSDASADTPEDKE